MMTDDILLSTAQAAAQVGVSEGTIRSWQSRKSEQFREGEHFIKSDGRQLLWTGEGLTLLQSLSGKPRNSSSCSNAIPAVTGESAVEAIAWDLIERELPNWVQASIQRVLYSPSPADRQRLKGILERLAPQLSRITHRAALESGVSPEALGSVTSDGRLLEGSRNE